MLPDKAEEFVLNISSFMKIFESNANLKNFVKNPTYSVESQKMVFEKILTHMKLNKILKNFFLVLIAKKRIFFLDTIIEEFLKLVAHKKGEISGSLISSKNPTFVQYFFFLQPTFGGFILAFPRTRKQ